MARMPSVPALRFISIRRTSSCSMIRTRSALPAEERPLDPFLGILQDRRRCSQAQRLDPAAHAGLVHHQEHLGHAAVRLAHQDPAAFAIFPEAQGGGGRSVDPHLVLDAGARHSLGSPRVPSSVHPDLGDDEKGDALGPLGGSLDPGQHQMDDVLGQVMVPAGDEALFPRSCRWRRRGWPSWSPCPRPNRRPSPSGTCSRPTSPGTFSARTVP